MLIHLGKPLHLGDGHLHFVHRNKQADALFGQLIEQRIHLRAPIAHARRFVIPFEADELPDRNARKLATAQRIEEVARRHQRLVKNVFEHTFRSSGTSGYPPLRFGFGGHERKQRCFPGASSAGNDSA